MARNELYVIYVSGMSYNSSINYTVKILKKKNQLTNLQQGSDYKTVTALIFKTFQNMSLFKEIHN